MKINNFRGDLTDISAKKEALVAECSSMELSDGVSSTTEERAESDAKQKKDKVNLQACIHSDDVSIKQSCLETCCQKGLSSYE